MREIRLSGSEGGGAESNRPSLPLCAPESAHNQRGESPLQVYALRLETECNCVVVTRGGEQQEVNDQSVEERTRFGRVLLVSLRRNGETQTERKFDELSGSVIKRHQKNTRCLETE